MQKPLSLRTEKKKPTIFKKLTFRGGGGMFNEHCSYLLSDLLNITKVSIILLSILVYQGKTSSTTLLVKTG